MNIKLKKNIFTFSGIIIGAIGGFLYWNFVGCANGQCMIQSKWYLMTLYGIILGGVIGNAIQGFTKKEKVTE